MVHTIKPVNIHSHTSELTLYFDAQEEMKKLWQIKLVLPNSILELRAIKHGAAPIVKIFKGTDHINVEALQIAFENEAVNLNQQGYNIYVVMNPIKESFIGYSASDADIQNRDLLLIDIDRAHKASEPANQAELDAALCLAHDIAKYLESHGWGKPIRMMSGNGYHLYYILNQVPNDNHHKELVAGALQELADYFDNSVVKVDTVVFNASRITKVPGTIAYKGTASIDRPYRMAKVVS